MKQDYILDLDTYYEIIGDYAFCKSPQWEIDKRGFPTNGMGDLGTRTAKFAIAKQSTEMVLASIRLLNDYKRWPDWCEPGRKERKRLKKAGFDGFRGQRSLTRDPYRYCLVAISEQKGISEAVKHSLYKKVRIPFWINRLPLWLFKRALLNPKWQPIFQRVKIGEIWFRNLLDPRREIWWEKKEKAKENGQGFREWWYDALQKSLGFAGFHKHQMAWQLYTTNSMKAQAKLCKTVPHWNYVLMLLCDKPTVYLCQHFIKNYKGMEGYLWSADKYKLRERIPEDEALKLDEDLLNYLWNNYNLKQKS